MKIRDARASDLAALVALEEAVYDQPWPEPVIEGELAQRNRIYLVIEERGRLIGFGGLMLVDEDAHVTTLGIAPGHRRKGLASRLLLDLIDRALESGVHHLTLEVRESNTDAQQLYERFGLAAVGKRHGYYSTEDAVVMWATDIDGAEYQQRLATIRQALWVAA